MTRDPAGAPEIDVDELAALLQGAGAPVLIDVRKPTNRQPGYWLARP